MGQNSRGSNFYQHDMINHLIQLGYLEAGVDADAGKYKLSTKGLSEADRILNALDAKHKVLLKYKINGNAFADAKTLF